MKARFENVQGLVAGNNVRYAGIQTRTPKRIKSSVIWSLKSLLTGSCFAQSLKAAVLKRKFAGDQAESLAVDVDKAVKSRENDSNNGKGPLNTLFKDSVLTIRLKASRDNIQKGTDGFNRNMEALNTIFCYAVISENRKNKKEKSSCNQL